MTQPAYKLSIILLGKLHGKVKPTWQMSKDLHPHTKKKKERVLVVVLIISFNCVLFAYLWVGFTFSVTKSSIHPLTK